MAKQYDDENSGVLFREKEKRSERGPDFTGKIFVGGKKLQLAAWEKQGRNGTFLSLRVSEFTDKPRQDAPKGAQAGTGGGGGRTPELEDDIPFVRPDLPF